MHNIHTYHIGIVVLVILISGSLYLGRDFLKECLSEFKDGKNSGSSKRLIVFMFGVTISLCEIYHTLKQGKLDTNHLMIFLTAMLIFSGLATVPQIIDAVKGKFLTVSTETETNTEKKTETISNSN